ncbi:hypothetical protein FIBSPDRAFT_1043789 [Athelia psychrophila]|uniref:BTB domain-containing protein n=1 Tax=Athelia psychrophila TaxID=1759441 RepID=A0A166KN62_9AGAM|nr:hypothetical protein FIBSPDRAFT_1043789 [Fibularhizoctonia sp. CBS 109695]
MSSTSGNPSKRARTEERVLTRHPTLWFDDGSIILNVETTSFCVHRSTLCSHSSVFADMFSLPQLSTQDEQDGCPVVDMPDNAEDFTCLLRVLYEPYIFLDDLNETSYTGENLRADFNTACRVLRVSTKYIMPGIRNRSIKQIERHLPITFPAFDIREKTNAYRTLKCSDLVHAIGVARETGVQWILPMIFYRLCQYNVDSIFNAKNYAQLSKEDIRAWMKGREALLGAMVLAKPLCISICGRCIDFTGRDFLKPASELIVAQTSLFSRAVLGLINVNNVFPNGCKFCIESLTTSAAARREEAWEKLPGYFDLPPWAELLAARASAS